MLIEFEGAECQHRLVRLELLEEPATACIPDLKEEEAHVRQPSSSLGVGEGDRMDHKVKKSCCSTFPLSDVSEACLPEGCLKATHFMGSG